MSLVRGVLLVDGVRVGRLYRRGPSHVVLQDGTTLPYEFDTRDAALDFVRGLARIGCYADAMRDAGPAEPEGPAP